MSDDTGRMISRAMEDHLKAIYKYQQEGEAVSTNALAAKMATSPAAVTKMLKHLAEHELIDYTRYRGVKLTASGERIALELIRHHRLLETYLHQALGYTWDEVDAEAERLEHHISEEFEERIDEWMNHPTVDPHGAPIPTSDGRIAPLQGCPLASFDPGERVVVRRVRDSDALLLRQLTDYGIRLGTVLDIVENPVTGGPMAVRIGDRLHVLNRAQAEQIFVELVEARNDEG